MHNMVDEEVKALLNRLALRIVQEKQREMKCCKSHVEIGYKIADRKELTRVFEICRAVFINFYSPICPHCEMFKHVFYSIAKKYHSKAAFVRINVFDVPESVREYSVLGVPTTIVIVDGNEYDRIVGYVPKNVFERIVLMTLDKIGCLDK